MDTTISINHNFIVYKHTNKINNKVYIGITGQTPSQRWKAGAGYKNNTHFFSSIKKYGWNNFEHSILKENLSEEEAKILEEEYIKKYDSTNPEKGYNVATSSVEGHSQITEKTKEKIKRTRYFKNNGNYHSNESLQKMKQSRKDYWNNITSDKYNNHCQHMKDSHADFSGEKNPMYGNGEKVSGNKNGRWHNEEASKKASLKLKGRHLTEEHKEKLRVPKPQKYRDSMNLRKQKYKEYTENGMFKGSWNEWQSFCKENKLFLPI